MGAIGGAVSNLFGGGSNSGFTAQSAPIATPTTAGQVQQAYGQTQGGISGSQALANQLAQNGGLQNQQATANMLLQMAQGQGPNPAQDMLNQSTGQNVANQAALAAGQRGASANPGMIARLAAQQGANTQQQAVGQAATLGSQQQVNALGQLGSLGTQQVQQQLAGQQGLNSAVQGQQQNLLNAIQGQNTSNVQNQSNMNNTNAAMAQTNANNTSGLIGGLLGGAGSAISGLLGSGGAAGGGLSGLMAGAGETVAANPELLAVAAKGGMVPNDLQYAVGGKVENPKLAAVSKSNMFSDKLYPEHMKTMATMYHPERFADGGQVDLGSPYPIANVSTAGKQMTDAYENGSGDDNKAKGGMIDGESYANQMKLVPGKAKVKGDSLKNDIIPAKLSPGELIIPKSVMEAKDPLKEGTKFLAEALKKHGKSGNEESDFKQALSKAASKR